MTEWEVLLCNGEILRTKQHNIYEYEGRLVFCDENDDHVGGVAMGMWIWFRHAEKSETPPIFITVTQNGVMDIDQMRQVILETVRDAVRKG